MDSWLILQRQSPLLKGSKPLYYAVAHTDNGVDAALLLVGGAGHLMRAQY